MHRIHVALLCVIFAVLVQSGLGNLYGIITGFAGENTQTVVLTVEVDPTTGNFTTITENFFYVGSSATYDGISAFDQKNQYLFYSTNFESGFVFGVDVSSGRLLPPISIGAEAVSSISWDGTNDQILMNGVFQDESEVLITYPYKGASEELINFTTVGVGSIYGAALDWQKGIYYLTFYNETSSAFELGSFPIANPSAIPTRSLGCGKELDPNFIFFDTSSGNLLGIGFNATALEYRYFEVVGTTCTVKEINLTGIVTCATYDPTTGTLYLGYVDQNGTALIIYNVKSGNITSLTTPDVLEDIQVSYKL